MASAYRTFKFDFGWLYTCLYFTGAIVTFGISVSVIRATPNDDDDANNNSVSRSQRDITPANDNFSWQVKLRSLAALRCSGVLLDSAWVLTAASCFEGNFRHPSSYNIELSSFYNGDNNVPDSGSFSITTTTSTTTTTSPVKTNPRGQSKYVESFYLHGRFTEGGILHNLALVHLHGNVSSSSAPADVITASDDVNSVDCLTVGWGSNGTGEPVRPRIRHWSVMNSTLCSQSYNLTVNPAQLCAQLQDSRTGTCTGDIGAPLMCRKNGTWTVTGIVTHIWRCHDNDQDPQPARFLSVQHYLPFVEKRGNFKDLPTFAGLALEPK